MKQGAILQRLINAGTKLWMPVFDRPLPAPTGNELKLVARLRDRFRELQLVEADASSSSEATWVDYARRLTKMVLESDPREFLRWDVILETMFLANPEIVREEWRYISRFSDWRDRWRKAIKESPVGRPFHYPHYPKSSGTLIQHAYHLGQFEERTGARLGEIDYIVEFGGGYGSMCRLFHNLGFKGKYVIFDLPHFSALQQFFLESIGIKVNTIHESGAAVAGVTCTSDLEQLRLLISDGIADHNSLFVGTWSISETPIQLRQSFLPLLTHFSAFLIAYQHEYGGVDNRQFFGKWKENMDKQIVWQDSLIDHLPGNSYLFGTRVRTPAIRFSLAASA